MAIIPLRQRVTVHKPAIRDDWGDVISEAPFDLKCRADEKTEVVTGQAGEEVISGVQFLFDKIPDIRYDDTIEYSNEIGVTIKRKPVRIEPIRMINGKASLTAVYL